MSGKSYFTNVFVLMRKSIRSLRPYSAYFLREGTKVFKINEMIPSIHQNKISTIKRERDAASILMFTKTEIPHTELACH